MSWPGWCGGSRPGSGAGWSCSVVQYGATRERLRAIAEAGDGWDVLHLSGHGGRGVPAGKRRTGRPIRSVPPTWSGCWGRCGAGCRLAVVSACGSAAATTAETLRWVGLEEQAEQLEQQAEQEAGCRRGRGAAEPVMTGVARALVAGAGLPGGGDAVPGRPTSSRSRSPRSCTSGC